MKKALTIVIAALTLMACGPSSDDVSSARFLREQVSTQMEIVKASKDLYVRSGKKVHLDSQMSAEAELKRLEGVYSTFCREHKGACS